MTDQLRIETDPKRDTATFHSYYVAGAHTLAIESSVERPCPIGIDVDGSLIFDLDEEREIVHVDLVADSSSWRVTDLPEFRSIGLRTLRFCADTVEKKSFPDLPVEVLCSRSRDTVLITIGDQHVGHATAVSLSAGVLALTSGPILTGLVVHGVAYRS